MANDTKLQKMLADLAAYRQRSATSSPPNAGAANALADYRAKKAGRFNVPESPEARKAKLGNWASETAALQKESDRLNSPLGILKETLRGTGRTLFSGQIGTGETLGQSFAAGSVADSLTAAAQSSADIKVSLLKEIKKREAAGRDATKLKQLYNEAAAQKIPTMEDIIPATQKTNKQALGEVALVGLDALTAGTYGKAATGMATGKLAQSASTLPTAVQAIRRTASTPSGLFTAKGASRVAAGGAAGYAYDVAGGFASGEREPFTPGLGTLIGAGIPALSEGAKSVSNVFDPKVKAQRLVDARKAELDKLDALQTLKKATEKGRERGIDVKRILAEEDVLSGAVDNTGNITTKGSGGAMEQYSQKYIDANESIVSEALRKEGKSISPEVVRAKLTSAIDNAGIEGASLDAALSKVEKEMAGYARRAGQSGVIPLDVLHSAKVDKYGGINFFTPGDVKKYDKTVAKALKELVEANSKSIDVKGVNAELSKHFAVMDYLERLDGKKVNGGKLGKYFAKVVGSVVGTAAGGPLGGIVGAELGGRVQGANMARTFQGKTGFTQPAGEAMTAARGFLDEPPAQLPAGAARGSVNALPSPRDPMIVTPEGQAYPRTQEGADAAYGARQSSNSAGSRNQSQSPTTMAVKIGTPSTLPAASKGVKAAVPTRKISVPASLVAEARKYRTAEEFVKAQEPVFHGGAGVDSLEKGFSILSPSEKMKLPSSNVGLNGVSLTTDRNIAREYSRNIGGTDRVFATYQNPAAKVKKVDTKGEGLDEMFTFDEIEEIKRQGFDAIKDVSDGAEREYRAITDKAVISRKELLDIYRAANREAPSMDYAAQKETFTQRIARAEDEATTQTLAEMELSRPGYRAMTGYGKDREVRGVPSTFPKWVPEKLRSSKLFDEVAEAISSGKKPTKPSALALYEIIQKKIDARRAALLNEEPINIDDIPF